MDRGRGGEMRPDKIGQIKFSDMGPKALNFELVH